MPHPSPTVGRPAAQCVHRGPALLLVAALTLVTAVALLRAEAVIADTWVAADSTIASEEVIRRYYAAANAVIATGEVDELAAVVAQDLVLAPGLSEDATASGRQVLIDRFLALHAVQPSLRLVVRDMVADEDDVIARVAIEGTKSGLPPAVHLSQFGEDWLDGFHVQQGMVAAAWGATVGLSSSSFVLSIEISDPHPVQPIVGLTRLTLAAGTQMQVLVGPGPMVVMPEAKSLRVRIDGIGRLTRVAGRDAPAPTLTENGVPVDLGPGDQAAIDAGVSFTLRNPGDEPTVVLVAGVYPSVAFDPVSFTNAGVETRSLAVAIFEPDDRRLAEGGADHLNDPSISWEVLAREKVLVPEDTFQLYVERVFLAPGGVIPTFHPTDSMLVAVEQGTVVVVVKRGPRNEEQLPVTLLEDDESSRLQSGAAATIRNVGDEFAAILALTITPAGAAAGSGTATVLAPPL